MRLRGLVSVNVDGSSSQLAGPSPASLSYPSPLQVVNPTPVAPSADSLTPSYIVQPNGVMAFTQSPVFPWLAGGLMGLVVGILFAE